MTMRERISEKVNDLINSVRGETEESIQLNRVKALSDHLFYMEGESQYDCICGKVCRTRERWNQHYLDQTHPVIREISEGSYR